MDITSDNCARVMFALANGDVRLIPKYSNAGIHIYVFNGEDVTSIVCALESDRRIRLDAVNDRWDILDEKERDKEFNRAFNRR